MDFPHGWIISTRSIRLEMRFISFRETCILVALPEQTVAYGEQVELTSHEAAESVLRCADNRLATHVETRIHKDGTTRQCVKASQQGVKPRVRIVVHGLYARRIVDRKST